MELGPYLNINICNSCMTTGWNLVKAFNILLKDNEVVENWRPLCKKLHVPLDDINEIDSTDGMTPVSLEEKCYNGLTRWRHSPGADVETLQRTLVEMGFRTASGKYALLYALITPLHQECAFKVN